MYNLQFTEHMCNVYVYCIVYKVHEQYTGILPYLPGLHSCELPFLRKPRTVKSSYTRIQGPYFYKKKRLVFFRNDKGQIFRYTTFFNVVIQ